MTPRQIHLHIDELVLFGLAAADRDRIGTAFTRELAELMEKGPLPGLAQASHAAATLPAAPITIGSGTRAESVGVELARSIYGGLRARAEQPAGSAAARRQR